MDEMDKDKDLETDMHRVDWESPSCIEKFEYEPYEPESTTEQDGESDKVVHST